MRAGALNAYTKAAHYGPPGTDVAPFMMGQCYEILEESEKAVDSYLLCLQLDAWAVSAVERLSELASTGGCEKQVTITNRRIDSWLCIARGRGSSLSAVPIAEEKCLERLRSRVPA
jgi:hypothetical protein